MTGLDFFSEVQVEHPRHVKAVEQVCESIRLAMRAGGGCVPFLGPTRIGKKYVLDHVESEIGREVTGPGSILPGSSFLRGQIPPKPNETDLYASILAARSARFHARERSRELRVRVGQFLEDHGVEVVALDECSHCAEPGANFSKRSATDHFKVLIENTGIVLVLTGLPKFQRLIAENEQFRDRSMATVELHPYRWSNEADRNDFLGAAYSLIDVTKDAGYGFRIDEEDLVRRLYSASGGRIARVVQLLGYTLEFATTPRMLTLNDFQKMSRTALQPRDGVPDAFAAEHPTDLELERSYVLVMQEADLAVPVDNLTTYSALSEGCEK